MNIENLLENKHTAFLEWCEPWPATGTEGYEIIADVHIKATVYDCINLARSVAKALGRPWTENDAELLKDFVAVNWAYVVEEK